MWSLKAIIKASPLLMSLFVPSAQAETWAAIGVAAASNQTVYVDIDSIEREGGFARFWLKIGVEKSPLSFNAYTEAIDQVALNCEERTVAVTKSLGVRSNGERVSVKEVAPSDWSFSKVVDTSPVGNHWDTFCPQNVTRSQTTASRERRPTDSVNTAAHGEKWVVFGASLGGVPGTKGQPLYLDINAIERTGVFTGIWLKIELVSVNADNFSGTIQRLIVDCGNNTFATEKVIGVRSNGERISIKDTVPKIADFKKVSPDFLADNRWGLVCPAGVTNSQPSPPPVAQPNTPPAEPTSPGFSTGSGFFVTPDGYFVTNYHVIAGAEAIALFDVNSKMHMARVVRVDKANDIAVLKAEGKFKAIPVIASRTAKRGQPVITVGYPYADIQGLEPKVTSGIINSLTGLSNDARTFQISVPLQSGNSGGPLVTLDGNVIGIVAMKLSALAMLEETGDLPQNVNYAVKSNYLTEVLLGIPGVERKLLPPSVRPYKDVSALTAAIETATALVVSTVNAK